MSHDVLLITRALDFATRAHTDQRRKGEREEPYINHLADVAWMLAQATAGNDSALIAAGLLHDTIEDQGVTHTALADEFGKDVADLVAEVTDDKSLAKAERKRLQIEHAPHKSDRARMLKIADKTSNLRAILHSPPTDWTQERKHEYFNWADSVVAGCRGVNAWLETQFDDALLAGKTHL
jgi:GTP diphosphokinase / guanosine-3',5'-bis(diphosphate) 3'-diphosphatase